MLYTAPMDSVFDIIGPPMVGPSSSHTAGAIRIGRAARALLGATPVQARIGLHGSFAATGAGHATDRGLVAGLLGFATDDERMKDALDHARAAGLTVEFEAVHLGDQVHPNTASIEGVTADGVRRRLIASSLGGGMVQVVSVDGFPTSFTGALDTLVLWHSDVAGFLARVTSIIACVETNIAAIRTARRHRGESALTVVEMDAPLPASALDLLGRLRSVSEVRMLERF
ncbi:MAG: L-serine ammonia-lyase, iron-sulfur-dependent subunit beta [Kiritimatiellae bacterium]|nr:L-serine ammonia-lyase, iron-sulfur-dependent subunit beta [Kiritimatiellia bacterium]